MKLTAFIFISTTILLSACSLDDIIDDIQDGFVDFGPDLVETTSRPSDPDRVLPPNPVDCPDYQKDSTIDITESLTLPTGCKYDRVNFRITNKSDLIFDCNGAEFNGLDREFRQAVGEAYSVENAPLDFGIKVQSSESAQSRNITIRNCNLKNYVRGIIISLGLNETSRSDLKNNANVAALENHLRNISPKNIRVENSNITFSHKDGVFVGRYITDFVMDNSEIKATGAVGLYLDSGSQRNTIKNSTFIQNGLSDYNSSKRLRRRKLANDTREAIAIDSSAHNTIENNIFSRNSRGSVLIYKNCNEHAQDPNQIPRYQSADNNVIRSNQFNDERIGVWVASRQSKNLADLECGSPIVDTGKVRFGPVEEDAKYYEDFAKHNQITQNTFNNVKNSILIEDDDTSVLSNEFKGAAGIDIVVGTKFRTQKLSHPVTTTRIENNQFNSSTSEHIQLIFNPVGTNIKNNTPASVNN